MKVKELIAELQKQDPEADVWMDEHGPLTELWVGPDNRVWMCESES